MVVSVLIPTAAHAAGRGPAAARSQDPARASLHLQLAGNPPALVVGQALPVTIRADFLAGTGVTLNGIPRLASDGFTLSGLPDKPRQTQVERGGLPYTELTWTGALTAVQAGAAAPAIELPVELSYREPLAAPAADDASESPSPFASLFANTPLASDPFFAQVLKDDPFSRMFQDMGGAVRQRAVTLRDEAPHLAVTAPPRPTPAGFGGAVGSFRASSALSPGPFRVGEPVTLTLRVEGHGSFDRLGTPGVADDQALSAYPPRAAFTPGHSPTEGAKVFTQTLVPRRSGSLEIPGVALVTFDPQHHRYVTERTRPFSLSVAAAADGEPTAKAASAAGPAPGHPAFAAQTQAAADPAPRSLSPAIRQAWFWWCAAGLTIAALLASLAATAGVRRSLAKLFARRATSSVVARARRRMDAAVAAADPTALFGAARAGLQACLSRAWSMPADAISAADVERRLGERGARVREIFEWADRCTYGGARPPAGDLRAWRHLAARELDMLKEEAA